MKVVWLMIITAYSLGLPSAQGASARSIRCQGHSLRTLTQTNFGLMTEQWDGQFEVAQGFVNTHLSDNDRVRLYRFQNGDQWLLNMRNGRNFYFFKGENTLIPCIAGSWYPLRANTPPPYRD